MPPLMANAAVVLVFLLIIIALFFFILTRGALLMRELSSGPADEKAHVYPIYSNMRLIKLVDYQPLSSAILLFQYNRLVAKIVSGIRQLDLQNKKVLVTSCAFGDVIPRVVGAALQSGAERILTADLVDNELINARDKLGNHLERMEFIQDDATNLQLADGAVNVNVMFFLLHELPHHLKLRALDEAGRMLTSGGKLYLAEFHRPDPWVLRALGWVYFKVFEPYGLALWDTHDPVDCLQKLGGWSYERSTYFFGNFQVITATRI